MTSFSTSFSIIKPDDLHVHLRDGALLEIVAKHTARQFSRAIIMPNLVPPVTNTQLAGEYKARIEKAAGQGFEPLMTLYLTDNTEMQEIQKAAENGFVKGAKLYPAGATTNSDSGVTDISKIYHVLEEMQKQGLPLLIHGEVTNADIDIFDREKVFIEAILAPLTAKFPDLKIVFEHITTKDAAEFVAASGQNIAATITAHHLLFNRNHMLAGGIRPHYYCLPILKRNIHREALQKAALGDSGKFFAGTDSAPHILAKKESSCGCAGCYTAAYALELYAQVFDKAEDLSKPASQAKFENFMSKFGADFYGLPYNNEQITLHKISQKIAEKISTPEGDIIPLLAGEEIDWSVVYAA
ncbi:MAG: dihydroorotase [Alphaproteobacteria bacterium CG11_big_fil_rev_8_21_14_0_20_44_7]|nr:MAG: dihydroorotase [Alphaproteobacteria bacterium CG11_big_fil_rev_8_21_14_0_20_44_7]